MKTGETNVGPGTEQGSGGDPSQAQGQNQGQNQDEGPTSTGQTAEDIFAAEAARLVGEDNGRAPEPRVERVEGEPQGFSDLGDQTQETPQVQGSAEEQGSGEQGEPSQEVDPPADTEDGDDGEKKRNSWKEWKNKYEETAQKMQELEQRLAAQEQQGDANPEAKPEAKKEEEPPAAPFEMSKDVKELLDYTPGLKEYLQHETKEQAKAIARELIEKELSTRDTQAAQAKEKEVVQAQDNTFWENVGNWFGSEYPELSLVDVKQSPEFNDWLNANQNWVNAQLGAIKDRTDISGAKQVYKKYIDLTYPNAGKKEQPPEDDGEAGKKLAAARTPSIPTSPSAPSSPTDLGDVWNNAVAGINQKAKGNIRTTI